MKRKIRLWIWAIFWTGSLFFVLPSGTASAHPADMYAQEQSVQITRVGLQIDWKITPGPMLAGTLWDDVDQMHNGIVTQAEAQAWIAPYLLQWVIQLDGHPLTIQLKNIRWPDTLDALQAGGQPIEVQMQADWPAGNFTGKNLLELHNTFQEPISLNWYSIKSDPGYSFDEPNQTNGLLLLNLAFSGPPSGLTDWESGKPSLPGISGVMTNLAANLANSASGQVQNSNQANPSAALVGLIRTQTFTPWFLLSAFLLSIALGSLHALTPGHGKTLVAAYLVGSHGKTRDAVFLGSVVTLTHTGSVLILGLVILIASRYILATLITPWLEVISGLLVVIFGLSLLVRRGREFYAWTVSQRTTKLAGRFVSTGSKIGLAPTTGRAVGLHVHPHPHAHDEASHLHSDSSTIQPGHTHTHTLPGDRITWKSLLALGVSGGLVPCPDAIAILLVAVSLNRIPFGMLLIVSFSLGLALVLIAIGIAMVQGARFLRRNDLLNRFSVYSPLVSGVVVLALGVGLSLSAGHNLLTTPPSAPIMVQVPAPSFDLKQARLVYLAPDPDNNDQLYVMPLSTRQPQAYTQEPEGVVSYTLSPDLSTILYSVLSRTGASAIWSMDRDGAQKHLVLECPQAQCGGPVWSPNDQKLVYERYDYAQKAVSPSVVPLSTLWWLDLKTGETEPVFRDQAFPGFGPRFSPDGRWLSYVSPANNTIQIYNLQEDRSISVPQRSSLPEIWSPSGDAILYWSDISTDVSPGAAPFLQLKSYLLTSGQVVDLGGNDNQEDLGAAWSPNGQWIAVLRGTLSADNSSEQEEVWLVRPDGSQGHALESEADVSYGDLNWTPDSQSLVFDRYSQTGVGDIWLINIVTGQQTKLVSGGFLPALIP